MEHIYDIIILGGGPAGYTGALYAARAEFDTLVIERMSAGGQMTLTDTIDNYPGFPDGKDGFELGMNMQQGAEKYGAITEYAEVESVGFSDKTKIINTSNGIFYAKAVIIATGANPRKLGLPDEEKLTGRGIHYCAHCDGRFYKDKTVVVVGGGNSAAEDALYLSALAKKVYVIHRRNELRAEKYYHKALMNAENIEFIWNSEVHSAVYNEKVTAVKITGTSDNGTLILPCDGIFISIGREPATQFLKDSVNIDENGYVIADETTRTNIDGVFAAGDVRTKDLRQVVTAVADGAVAVNFAEKFLRR